MVKVTQSVTCAECGAALGSNSKGGGHACAKCGSTSVVRGIIASDVAALELYEEVRLKQRDPSLRSKDKLRKDTLIVDGKDRSGRYIAKRRVIDKVNNAYLEHVEDKSTGEVVHHDEGPLSGHVGHGTAKRGRDDA